MKRAPLVVPVILALAISFAVGGCASGRARQPKAAPAAKIEINQDETAAHLAGAVRIKTISYTEPGKTDKTQLTAFHDYLKQTYPKAHAAMEREVVNEYSLLFTWKGSEPALEPILLMAHMDVVPVEGGSETEWAHPAFAGEIADGFVWGRGSIDDKASVIGLMEAAERMAAEGFKPKRTIYFAFGHDEEIGGIEGAMKVAALLKSRGVKLEYVLDEGMAVLKGVVPGVAAPVALIGIAEKGYATLELTVETKGGHSSQPPKSTAIGILSEAVAELEEHPFPASIRGPIKDMFKALRPEMPFGMRIIFGNLWLFGGLVESKLAAAPSTNATIRTTTAVTVIEGGVKDNVLPSKARALVNFRIIPGETIETVKTRAEKIIDDPRVKIAVREGAVDPSKISKTNLPAYLMLEETIHQSFPEAVVAPALVVGGTDSRAYSDLSDCVYRFQPVTFVSEDLSRIHGKDERMPVEGFANAVRFFVQILRNSGD